MKNRTYLLIEFTALYLLLPLVFYFDLLPIPKIAALLGITLICVLILWFDRSLDFSHLFHMPERVGFKGLAVKGGAVALVIFLIVWLVQSGELFSFPREEPVVWMVVILLYPLLSALPQELLYREYFFQRYEDLFPSDAMLGYASVAAFCFLHIIYDNWWAIVLSLAGGLLFAATYRKTKSLYLVSLEHALYGCFVFTIGMGDYFYEPF